MHTTKTQQRFTANPPVCAPLSLIVKSAFALCFMLCSQHVLLGQCAPATGTESFENNLGSIASGAPSATGTAECYEFTVFSVTGTSTIESDGSDIKLRNDDLVIRFDIKSSNGSEFKLENFVFFKQSTDYDGNMTITGFKDGSLISAAEETVSVGGFSPQTADLSSNTAFQDIDQIRLTFSNSNASGLFLFREITISDAIDCNLTDMEDPVVTCPQLTTSADVRVQIARFDGGANDAVSFNIRDANNQIIGSGNTTSGFSVTGFDFDLPCDADYTFEYSDNIASGATNVQVNVQYFVGEPTENLVTLEPGTTGIYPFTLDPCNLTLPDGECTIDLGNLNPISLPTDNCDPDPSLSWELTGATTRSGTGNFNENGAQPFNAGTTTLTYYIEDNAGNIGACNTEIVVEGSGGPDASFNYSGASYCLNDSDPTPTITGETGGTFSSTAGLSLNSATGAIDVSASTPGTYTVTYTVTGTSCDGNSNVEVTISGIDDASFNYSAAAYCVDDNDPTPTITGLTGGTFSGSPAGLSINFATGVIDLSASTPNTYTVTYTTAGGCPNSSNVSLVINGLDDASFNYSAAAYCVDDNDPTPTITGLTGGTFSGSPAGLSINPATGVIDLSDSTPNMYTVTYTSAGGCPNSSNLSVTINALDDAGFSYSTDTFCPDADDPTPTVTGLSGGTFSSTTGLSIHSSTGQIDVSGSIAGTYTVTYTTAGTCPNTGNDDLEVFATPTLSFTPPNDLCIDAGVQTGLSGATPAGGEYSGTGITDNGDGTFTLNPILAGEGSLDITYTLVTEDNCTVDITESMAINAACGCPDGETTYFYCYDANETDQVAFEVCPNSGEYAVANIQQGVFAGDGDLLTVYDGTSGSTTSGTAIFSETGDVSGSLVRSFTIDNCLIFVINSGSSGSCLPEGTTHLPLQACGSSTDQGVSFTAPDDLCIDAGIQTGLEGGIPAGGVYSGPGVVDGEDGQTYSFDPSVAGTGVHTIVYTANGVMAEDQIEVFALPMVSFTAPNDLCVDAGVQMGLSGGSPTGGTYSGTGVTDDDNGMTFSFDPAAATAGTHTLTYTYTDGNGCTVTANDEITVNTLPVVSFTNPGVFCVEDPSVNSLGGGSPTGGVYSGTGVIDNGNGSTFSFTPQQVGNGMHTITYTYTDGNGCSNSESVMVEVNSSSCCTVPEAICNDLTIELCWNGEASIIPSDIGSGSEATCGLRSERLSTTDFFCDDLGDNTVTYTITDSNGDSDQCSSTVTVLPGETLAPPNVNVDIGQSNNGNYYAYHPCNRQFTIESSARNTTSGMEDDQAFIHIELCGDFTLQASLDSLTGDSGYGGLMVRESNDPGSRQISLLYNGSSLLRWERRPITNGVKATSLVSTTFPAFLRLVRDGDLVSAYTSTTGNSFQKINQTFLSLNECLEVGLTAFTNDPSGETRAVWSDVVYRGVEEEWSIEPSILELTPLIKTHHQAVTFITTDQAVGTLTPVTLTAGDSITLKPGFFAPQGSTFTARIEDCIPLNPNALWGGSSSAANDSGAAYRPEVIQLTGKDRLSAFPNPFSHQATITLDLLEDKQVDIGLFDLNGRLVQHVLPLSLQPSGKNQYTLDAKGVTPGMYILVVQSGVQYYKKRLVIMQ